MRRKEGDEGQARRPFPKLSSKELPFSRLIPNLVTIGGLCCGLSAIRWSLDGRWELCLAFIFAAAIIDGMDGRIARMLGSSSVFGAQLDSLSDFVCFGIAPAIVMYNWMLHDVKGVGWAVVLFYAVCAALRLARFNTVLSEDEPPAWQKRFFTGVPSPAGGVMCTWPLLVYIHSEGELVLPVYYSLLHVFAIALLMASRFPTMAAKNFRIKPEFVLPVMVTSAFVMVWFVIDPWGVAMYGTLAYLLHIPFSYQYYRRLQARHDDTELQP